MRRVAIHVAVSPHGDGEPDIVISCNDGTLWMLGHGGQWIELPGIPQDESKDPLAKLHSRHVDLLDAHAAAKTQLHMLADLAGTLSGSVGSGPRREALREAGGKIMTIIET